MPADRAGADEVVVTDDVLRRWPLPEPGKDKESRGRVLVIGGTAHTPGAVLLAGEAALRAGAGKLQIATAKPVAAALAVAVPEALVVPMDTDDEGNLAPETAEAVRELAGDADAVLLGPGFSDAQASADLLAHLLPGLESPVVLDAVASAYITRHRDGVSHLDGRAVLTVNPQELTHALEAQNEPTGGQAVEAARQLADTTRAVVLLGGQGKVIAAPSGQVWTVERGGPGLGVSGSGDVQAGLVAGLLSRGAEATQAAVWGGTLHGAAGDGLASRVGAVGFLAREIASCVPSLLERLGDAGSEGPALAGR